MHLMLALLTLQTSLGTVLLNRRKELISQSISWLQSTDIHFFNILKEKSFKDVRPQTNVTAVVLRGSFKSIRISLPLLNLRLLFAVSNKSICAFKMQQMAFSSVKHFCEDPVFYLSAWCHKPMPRLLSKLNFKTVFSKIGLSHIPLLLWVLPILCIPPDPGPQHIVLLCDSHFPLTGPTVGAEQGGRLICTFCKASVKAGSISSRNAEEEPIPKAWDQTSLRVEGAPKSPPQPPAEAESALRSDQVAQSLKPCRNWDCTASPGNQF